MIRVQKYTKPNDWIVVIVNTESLEVIQVHSTGIVVNGTDDNADNPSFMISIREAIEANQLHSQMHGRGGVRWPEQED